MRKDIEGYTERRKAVDKREEERKETWNILEGEKKRNKIEVMEEEGKLRGLRTRKGEKARRRRKGHAKDRRKELYRKRNEGGIKE